jgi:hypothetical protein
MHLGINRTKNGTLRGTLRQQAVQLQSLEKMLQSPKNDEHLAALQPLRSIKELVPLQEEIRL